MKFKVVYENEFGYFSMALFKSRKQAANFARAKQYAGVIKL